MLSIIVGTQEFWNKEREEFEFHGGTTLEFEHSLVSLSKWESKWQKSFLSNEEKSTEQTIDYIHFMLLTPDVPRERIEQLTPEEMKQIHDYIETDRTATKFAELPSRKVPNEKVTSELIYYWMTAFSIPWEAQYWHLSRLFALIRICNSKQPGQKQQRMSRRELAERNAELNRARREQYGTRG